MEIFRDIEQGSPEWFAIRAGMPTASCFHDVQQKPGPRGGLPKGRITYMRKLAGEIVTERPMENVQTFAMRRGKVNEAKARKFYAIINDVELEQVGFVKNGICGASPDSLIGNNGMLEVKDAEPHIQIERLLDGTLPPEHKAQCQGNLMVAEREWIDFMSHCDGMAPHIIRVYRDEPFIAALRVDIKRFVDELNQLVEWLRRM